MNLPTDFQFSQSSLQDFETCPKRFELRYLKKMRWPAIESEPVAEAERLGRLGQDFHRLLHQHLIGLSVDVLEADLLQAEPELQGWWANYRTHRPAALAQAELWPEVMLSAPLRGYRLLARFDLLARLPNGTFLIVDWKTSQRKPPRPWLARRMQTRVYPYVLVQAGAAYNQGQAIDSAAVTMLYWYAQFPTESEEIAYSQELFDRDETFLSETITQVKDAARRGDFPLVADDKPCRYCVYRSYCDRGESAGPLLEMERVDEVGEETADDLLSLDWDQIAEIQF